MCKELGVLMPNPTTVVEDDVVAPPFHHAATGVCAPVAVLQQRQHPALWPGHLLPRRFPDRVCNEPLAPPALSVGPLGRLALATGRLALDLADVVLPNVVRLVGCVEEEAEHVGRGLVVGDGCPVEAHEATLHVLVHENKREADDEAGLRVTGAGQVIDDGELALIVQPLHRFLPFQRHAHPHVALLGRLVHGLATP